MTENGVTQDYTIDKATPAEITFPTTASIVYDPIVTLANIALAGGSSNGTFAWVDSSTVPTVGNAGYEVIFTPNDDANYDYSSIILTRSVTLTVSKANYDMSGITFASKMVTYNGEAHSLAIDGELPDGLTVSYDNNDKTDAGTYTVTANFASTNDNYNIPVSKTATLTIDRVTQIQAAQIYNGVNLQLGRQFAHPAELRQRRIYHLV